MRGAGRRFRRGQRRLLLPRLAADFDAWACPAGRGTTSFRTSSTSRPTWTSTGRRTVGRARCRSVGHRIRGRGQSFVEAARDRVSVGRRPQRVRGHPRYRGRRRRPAEHRRRGRVRPRRGFLCRRWDAANLALLSRHAWGASGSPAAGPSASTRRTRRPDGVTADRIVLSAGAIGSAHLLMLSGIGAAARAGAAGVPWWRICPLGGPQRSPRMGAAGRLARRAGPAAAGGAAHHADGLEIRCYTAGFAAMIGDGRRSSADRPHLGVTLMRPRSRGRITLASADPACRRSSSTATTASPPTSPLGAGANWPTNWRARQRSGPVLVDVAAPVRHGADGRRRRGASTRSGAGCAVSTGYGWSTARSFPSSPAAARTPRS